MSHSSKFRGTFLLLLIACSMHSMGRDGRVGRAQVSKSRGPRFNPTDAVSNLGQVR